VAKKKLLLTRQKTKKQKQKKNKKKITMASTPASSSMLAVFPCVPMPAELLGAYIKMNKDIVFVHGQTNLTSELFRKHYLPVIQTKVEAGALFLLDTLSPVSELTSSTLVSLNYKNVIVFDLDGADSYGALKNSWGLYNAAKDHTEVLQACLFIARSMVVFLFGDALLDGAAEMVFYFLSVKFLEVPTPLSKAELLASLMALSRSESEDFRPLVINPNWRLVPADSVDPSRVERIRVLLGGSPPPPPPQADNTSSDEKKKTKSRCVCGKCP
jgi:hypothetical protein